MVLKTHFSESLDHTLVRSLERQDFPVVKREHDRSGEMAAQHVPGAVRIEKSDRRHLAVGISKAQMNRPINQAKGIVFTLLVMIHASTASGMCVGPVYAALCMVPPGPVWIQTSSRCILTASRRQNEHTFRENRYSVGCATVNGCDWNLCVHKCTCLVSMYRHSLPCTKVICSTPRLPSPQSPVTCTQPILAFYWVSMATKHVCVVCLRWDGRHHHSCSLADIRLLRPSKFRHHIWMLCVVVWLHKLNRICIMDQRIN